MTQPTLSELRAALQAEMARRQKDERLRFWNQEKRHVKQATAFASQKRTQGVFGGNRCIAGDTLIYDPVADTYREVQKIQGPFHVIAYDADTDSFVIAESSQPFRKEADDLYRFELSNGQSFTASLNHLVLTADGSYQPLSVCPVGCELYLPQSMLGHDLLVRDADAMRYWQRPEDFQDGYPAYSYCGGVPLRWDIVGDQVFALPQAHVPAHKEYVSAAVGGSDGKSEYNHPYPQFDHPSIQGVSLLNEDLYAVHEYHTADKDAKYVGSHSQVVPIPTDGYEVQSQSSGAVALSVLASGQTSEDGSLFSTSRSITSLRITSITFVRRDYKWDITVPKYHNYLLAGTIHHNSGKTVYGAVRTALFALGKHAEPYVEDWCAADKQAWYDFYAKLDSPIELWCATVNWDVHRDITQPELLKWIPAPILAKSEVVSRRKGVIDYILFPWNTRLTFKSYDSGREAFQGKSLKYLWLDEEPEPDIWNEVKMRLIDQKGYATLTMTPLKGLTWTYNEIYLNNAQDPTIEHYQFTWDDNPWLDEDEKNRLLVNMTEDEIAARKFGEFMASGKSVFSRVNLMERKRSVTQTPAKMDWSGNRFVLSPDGDLEIYQEPQPGRFYILSADVSEGLPSGDNSVGCVIDATTAEQVAELCVRVDTSTFADQLQWLGKYYNWAMIAPERNNNGHAVIQRLDKELLYPVLYAHEDERLGWPQTSVTRPIVIAAAQDMVRDAPERIRSRGMLDECLTFIRNDRGRPEASGKGKPGGQKDDRIFAWAIGLVVRDLYGPPLPVVKPKGPEKPKPMPQDDPWIHGDKDEDTMKQKATYATFDPKLYVDFEIRRRG